MKINQLPNGASFEYEGEAYVKTGPLFATGRRGQRLIPKYAVLKPLGDEEIAPGEKRIDGLSRTNVLNAFDTFYADCKYLIPEDQQMGLEAGRDLFLKAIG